MPVPRSGALTGVVVIGGFKPMAEGTASVCGAPALPTEPWSQPHASAMEKFTSFSDSSNVPHVIVPHCHLFASFENRWLVCLKCTKLTMCHQKARGRVSQTAVRTLIEAHILTAPCLVQRKLLKQELAYPTPLSDNASYGIRPN